jgi:hypothetical protein
MGRLNDIIQELKEIAKSNNLNVSDDYLFDNACSFVRGELASKDRAKQFVKNEWKPKNADMPLKKATDKQKGMLSKLKIPYTENTSMIEASKLIEEKLGKK